MRLKKIAFIALCAVMILTSSIIPTAFTVSAAEPIEKHVNIDYSNSASSHNIVLSASEFLKSMGCTVSDEEAAYINAYCDFKLRYDTVLKNSIEKKVTGKDDEPKKVEIVAQTYEYTAANGSTVVWTPVRAAIVSGTETVYSLSRDLSDPSTQDLDEYTFTFNDVELDLSYDYVVEYQIKDGITIIADDVNFVLNYAYNTVENAKSFIEFYGEEDSANAQAVRAYFQYLRDKADWDQKKAEFDAYPALMDKYRDDLAKYEEYVVAYNAYMNEKSAYDSAMSNYNQEMALYNAYLAELGTIEAQIKTLDDALFKKMTYLERELYGCFFSGLIDELIGQKNKIISLYPKLENAFNRCDEAKVAIRMILAPSNGKAYSAMTTTEEKYSFYINNYVGLRDNILKLTRSLFEVYTANGIKSAMHAASVANGRDDYTEKFAIFISQLVCFSDALSDTPLTYTNGQGKSFTASAIKLKYRTQAGNDVERTISQILEAEYVKDTNNATPITPPAFIPMPEVPSITAPTEPAKVIRPTEPPYAADPGEPPVAVTLPQEANGNFDWERYIGDESYKTLLCNLYEAFMDGKVTPRDQYAENLVYEPTFSVEKPFNDNSYITISFYDQDRNLIENVEIKKGSDVELDRPAPEKAEDICATYTFDCWVTEDGHPYDYSAMADVKLYPSYIVNYKEHEYDGQYLSITTENDLVRLPISNLAQIVQNEGRLGIRVSANDVGFEIKRAALLDLAYKGVDYLVADIDTSVAALHVCKIVAYDKAGEVVEDAEAELVVYLPVTDLNSEITFESTNTLAKDSDKGRVYYTARVNKQYDLSIKYNITVGNSSIKNVPTMAAPGDVITFEIETLLGMKAEAYYVLNGKEYAITGNSFVMPEGSIALGAVHTDIIYTVTFISDGKEIKKDYYKHGQSLVMPAIPTKINDEEYSYKFKRWDPITDDLVTADAVYVAVFERTPLPKEVDKINWLRVLVVLFFVLFITGLVVLILFILDRKKVISIKGICLAIGRLFSRKDNDDGGDVENSYASDAPVDSSPEEEHEVTDTPIETEENADSEAVDAPHEIEENDEYVPDEMVADSDAFVAFESGDTHIESVFDDYSEVTDATATPEKTDDFIEETSENDGEKEIGTEE